MFVFFENKANRATRIGADCRAYFGVDFSQEPTTIPKGIKVFISDGPDGMTSSIAKEKY